MSKITDGHKQIDVRHHSMTHSSIIRTFVNYMAYKLAALAG